MDKRKIAVIYDTSYLAGDFQSVKRFILSRRFSGRQKPGLLGSLVSMVGGKGRQAPAPGDTVYHQAEQVLHIYEVVPTEVSKEVARLQVGGEEGNRAIATLLESGAAQVDLALDTVVGEPPSEQQPIAQQLAEAARYEEEQTDEKLLGYAERLVGFDTNERYDLAIVATEDEELLLKIDELAKAGKAVLGLKSAQLQTTRALHDRLSAVASLGLPNKITMEN
jgi:hypothetical protein